ncbi:calcium-binding protein [Spiribacter insolitus]|uniref:Alkaline phosphatase n=1 Tax=Spiribacter insolitus TaxID=3122417 RepID=A0ABV3T3K6_9GAMM
MHDFKRLGTVANHTGGAGADSLTGGTGDDDFVIGDGDTGITVATADTIADFGTGANELGLGTAGDATAGTGNYVEAVAAVQDFAAALTAANTALSTLSDTTNSNTEIYAFEFDANNGYLFEDTDVDGAADQVVVLTGINDTGIEAADIIA